MNKKNIIVAVVLAVFVISGVYFWMDDSPTPTTQLKTTGKLMKVPRTYWPGMFWPEIADAKGWFKQAGLNVELVDANDDWYQSLQEMVDGKFDVNNFALFGLMDFNAKGADLVLVVNTDTSNGSEAIIAKNSIKTIKALKGKTIAVKKNDYTEYILDIVLKKNSMALSDVHLVDVKSEDAAETFIAGKVDAFIAYEPYASKGLKKGKGRKLFDTSQIPGISPNGYVFHRKFIEQRPQDVQAFVNVWHKTTEFIKAHPKEAFGIISRIYNKTPGEVQAFTQVDKLMDLEDNITAYSYGSGFNSLHGVAKKIHRYMMKRNLASKNILDSSTFLDHRFMMRLDRQQRKVKK